MSLVRQTSTYFIANAVSAAFGLLNVVIFTRLLSAADYGVYILGTGFSAILGTMLFTWLRQAVVRQEAKDDGTDMRGTVVLGFLVSLLPVPIVFLLADRLVPIDTPATIAAIVLCICMGIFELGLELVRARQQAMLVLRATVTRAVLVTLVGVAAVSLGAAGRGLLLAVALAYVLGTLLMLRGVWGGSPVRFDNTRLKYFIVWGFPLTLSMAVLSIAGMVDRFIVAGMLGVEAAGQYGASVDLVRQALIIPAISASAAFVPMAVKLLANDGREATHQHLEHCAELLGAITLPCCIGFALLAPRIGNVAFGPEFREAAGTIMPIVAIAVIFQIVVQQYLHISFFLSNRNHFYVINTVTTLIAGVAFSLVLIRYYGLPGAAWGRVASEFVGLLSALYLARHAFAVPLALLPLSRAALATAVMAAVVAACNPLFEGWDKTALAVLVPAGAVSYALACWVLDVAGIRGRLRRISLASLVRGQG